MLIVLGGLCGAALTGFAIHLWLASQRRRESAVASGRIVHGKASEERAAALLRQSGYEVVVAQACAKVRVAVDGVIETFDVYADFLVVDPASADLYVAEVKTGALALDVAHAPTRRQLLEYQLAFAPTAVLLVRPDDLTIRQVQFCGFAGGAPLPVPQQGFTQTVLQRRPSILRLGIDFVAAGGIAAALLTI